MALMHSLKHSRQCGTDKPAECSERIQHHSRMVHVPVVVIADSGKLTINYANRFTDIPPSTLAFSI